MIVRTETGSVYEINHEEKLIRRQSGEGPPTDRMEGGWRPFEDIFAGQLGMPLVIVWGDDVAALDPDAPPPIAKTTITSRVVEIV